MKKLYTAIFVIAATIGSLKVLVDSTSSGFAAASSLEANVSEAKTLVAQSNSEVRVYRKLVPAEPRTNRMGIDPKNLIDGKIVPSSWLVTPSPNDTPSVRVDVQSVALPQPSMPAFTNTIVTKDLHMMISDSEAQDGDRVKVLVNNKVVPGGESVQLTSLGQTFVLKNFQPGENVVEIAYVSAGRIPPLTLGIRLTGSRQVIHGGMNTSAELGPLQSFQFTVGYPQIALCMTFIQFPCNKLVRIQVSVQGIRDGIGNCSGEITANRAC
jgi:hypothetical protein